MLFTQITRRYDLPLNNWRMCDSWHGSLVSNGRDWRQCWWRDAMCQYEVHILSWALDNFNHAFLSCVDNLPSVSVDWGQLGGFLWTHLNESFSRWLTLKCEYNLNTNWKWVSRLSGHFRTFYFTYIMFVYVKSHRWEFEENTICKRILFASWDNEISSACPTLSKLVKQLEYTFCISLVVNRDMSHYHRYIIVRD